MEIGKYYKHIGNDYWEFYHAVQNWDDYRFL